MNVKNWSVGFGVAGFARRAPVRARVVLMLAAGESFGTIGATLECYPNYINR